MGFHVLLHCIHNPSFISSLFISPEPSILNMEDFQRKQLRLYKEINAQAPEQNKPLVQCAVEERSSFYPSVFPLHTQSHSS